MLKNVAGVVCLFQASWGYAASSAISGVVVVHFEICEYFIVRTHEHYVLMQWSSGMRPDLSAVLEGPLHSIDATPQTIMTRNSQSLGQFWIEEVLPHSVIQQHEIKDPCQCQ